MIFMGTYTGPRDGSSDDESTEEQPTDRDEHQPALDDFDEQDETTGSGDDSGGPPVTPIPEGGSSGSQPTAPVGEEPPEDNEHHESETDSEEQESEDEERSDDVELDESADNDYESEDDYEIDDEDESDEDDEDEDETITITIIVDPLSAMSWGNQPVIKRVQARYGEQVEVEYEVAPVRTFDTPNAMRAEWEASTEIHSMPVDASLWDNPPESTELLNRAVCAAMDQNATEPYLRALWMEGIAGGENLCNEHVLTNLADRIGLDIDQFRDDVATAEIETAQEIAELPRTEVPIKGHTQTWPGYVRYEDFKQQFIFDGVTEEGRPSLQDFVRTHGPVATPEVSEVYRWNRDEALTELRNEDGVEPIAIGETTFWTTFG